MNALDTGMRGHRRQCHALLAHRSLAKHAAHPHNKTKSNNENTTDTQNRNDSHNDNRKRQKTARQNPTPHNKNKKDNGKHKYKDQYTNAETNYKRKIQTNTHPQTQ